MKILCRLSTLIEIVLGASFAGLLLGCAIGTHLVGPRPDAALSAPIPQPARVLRAEPHELRREVTAWRPTRS